jgi:hypothetical protein
MLKKSDRHRDCFVKSKPLWCAIAWTDLFALAEMASQDHVLS